MKYEFIEGISVADVAFKAYGKNLDDLFANAAEAVFEVMVKTKSVDISVFRWDGHLKNKDIEHLLYDFLSELIAIKDEEGVILGGFETTIEKAGDLYKLEAIVTGDYIDPEKYEFGVDVKAVTMHKFCVEKRGDGYIATVVLDV